MEIVVDSIPCFFVLFLLGLKIEIFSYWVWDALKSQQLNCIFVILCFLNSKVWHCTPLTIFKVGSVCVWFCMCEREREHFQEVGKSFQSCFLFVLRIFFLLKLRIFHCLMFCFYIHSSFWFVTCFHTFLLPYFTVFLLKKGPL